MSIIIGISVYALDSTHVSFDVTLAQKQLQSQVRSTISWVVKDARQAVSWGMANNNPAPDYIAFRQVIGWDTANNTFLLGDQYIEYTYEAANHRIIRRTSDLSDNTIGVWSLDNVHSAPFFTLNSSGEVVPLNKDDLRTSKQLVISVTGQSSILNLPDITYTLTERVLIRNGE